MGSTMSHVNSRSVLIGTCSSSVQECTGLFGPDVLRQCAITAGLGFFQVCGAELGAVRTATAHRAEAAGASERSAGSNSVAVLAL